MQTILELAGVIAINLIIHANGGSFAEGIIAATLGMIYWEVSAILKVYESQHEDIR